jgi:hypothetical protein
MYYNFLLDAYYDHRRDNKDSRLDIAHFTVGTTNSVNLDNTISHIKIDHLVSFSEDFLLKLKFSK